MAVLRRFAIIAAVLLVGCSSPRSQNPAAEKSLYDRLGGEKAIAAVCEDFVGRAASDPKVNFFRKGVADYPEWKPSERELATFKKHLVDFVCAAAGGPQKYQGRTMAEAHKGMKITEAQFDAIAADLAASLGRSKIAEGDKAELLAAVAATKAEIVEVK